MWASQIFTSWNRIKTLLFRIQVLRQAVQVAVRASVSRSETRFFTDLDNPDCLQLAWRKEEIVAIAKKARPVDCHLSIQREARQSATAALRGATRIT